MSAAWEEEELDDEAAGTAGTGQPAPEPAFPDVTTFVTAYLAKVTEVRLGGQLTWCPQWWRHAGAMVRLEALWRAWEVLRLQPGGLSSWFTSHYDPHMRQLLDADHGPFSSCTRGHRPGGGLKVEAPPTNWRDLPLGS